jgi:hypothetical protein
MVAHEKDNNQFRREAPAPLEHFRDTKIVHPDNGELLKGHEPKILDKRSLKNAKKRLERVQQVINEYSGIVRQYKAYKKTGKKNLDKKRFLESYMLDRWGRWGDELTEHVRTVQQLRQTTRQLKKINPRVKKIQEYYKKRSDIQQRITEHRTALENEALNEKLQKQMATEANLYARIIRQTWVRLGYCYRYTNRNLKTVTVAPGFQYIEVTPDAIYFKVDISRMGLMGGTVHNLPRAVSAYDLVKEDTLRELTIATEREVQSPNLEGEAHWNKGVWLVVHRLGLSEGVLNYVRYEAVMAQYDLDQRTKIPLPLGVKQGRYINWVNLTKTVHLMINGQTGSGKTNAIRVILTTLINQHSPDEIRYTIVDLKRAGDFRGFDKTKHMIGNIITTVPQLYDFVQRVVMLMRSRLDLIAQHTHDIDQYNKLVSPDKKMPRLLIVLDDIANIKLDKELSPTIFDWLELIATQSRASGIHLLVGIQQSVRGTIPQLLRDNVTFVLSGHQRTAGASMSTFGTTIAKKIANIPGRMICDNGHDEPFPVQIPHVTQQDIDRAILKSHTWEQVINFDLPDLTTEDEFNETIQAMHRTVDKELLIEIAIEELGGNLGVRTLWEYGKQINIDAPRSKYDEIIGAINIGDKVQHDGIEYIVQKERKGKKLVKT